MVRSLFVAQGKIFPTVIAFPKTEGQSHRTRMLKFIRFFIEQLLPLKEYFLFQLVAPLLITARKQIPSIVTIGTTIKP